MLEFPKKPHEIVVTHHEMAYLLTDAFEGLSKGGARAEKAVHWLRNRCDPSLIGDAFSKLPSLSPELQNMLFGEAFPDNWKSCTSRRSNPAIQNVGRAIQWHTSVFEHFADSLSKHAEIRESVLRLSLKGEWDVLAAAILAHQTTFGLSQWVMGKTFFFNEERSGAAANKKVRDSLLTSLQGHMMSVIAVSLSLRAEKTVSPAQLSALIRHALAQTVEEEVRTFFNLLLAPDFVSLDCSITALLSLIEILPIIDRYELFVKIAILANAQAHPDAVRFQRALAKLSQAIDDPCLRFSSEVMNPESISTNQLEERLIDVWDMYVRGEYNRSAREAGTLAGSAAETFQAHELYTKSALYSKVPPPESRSSLLESLWHHLRIIYDKAELTEDSLAHLAAIALRLGDSALSYSLLATCELHSKPEPDSRLLRCAAFTARMHGPRNLEHGFDEKASISYLRNLFKLYPRSISLQFFLAVARNDTVLLATLPGIPAPRVSFFLGLSAMRKGEFSVACEELEKFLEDAGSSDHPWSPFAVEEARIVLARALAILGRVERLQQVVVESYLERTHSIKRFALQSIYALCFKERMRIASDIHHPILSYLANDNPHTVSMAVNLFLLKNECVKPSDVTLLPSKVSSTATLYFFIQRVCVPEVLDSLDFNSTAEVEEERIKLLRWLAKADESLRPVCQAEILRITEAAELREALHRIEGSRVEVNLAGIREAQESRFKEMFFRFAAFREVIPHIANIALQPLGLSPAGDTVYAATRDDFRRLISAKEGQAHLILLFSESFREIRDAFLNSPQFGLDACLSVRIRHGILTQHIRRPFFQDRLFIDPSDTKDGGVLEFWNGQIGVPDESFDVLSQLLRDLTEEVVDLADEIKDEWIQVKTETRDNRGLFDFSFDDALLAELFVQRGIAKMDYNGFVEAIFVILFERTRTILSAVRKKVHGALLQRLNDILRDAESTAAQLQARPGYSQLRDALSHCRTEIQAAIQTMSRWFLGSDVSLMEDVTMQLAANTAAGMVDRLHPGMRAHIKVLVKSAFKLKGRYFSAFVHLLFFLIDNALRHAGIAESDLLIGLEITCESNWIVIAARNQLNPEKDPEDCAKHMNARVADLLERFDFTKVRSEGGSGLVKILAAVTLEFSALRYHVHVSSEFGNCLQVRVEFEAAGIVA